MARGADDMTDRALRSKYVDLVRDGVAPKNLTERGRKATFGPLVSSAMSAYQRGWGYPEWADFVTEPASELGRQVRLGSRSSKAAVEKTLIKAWDMAVSNADSSPAWTREQISEMARTRARGARELMGKPRADLTANERQILRHVIALTDERARCRHTLPRRAVMEATGLKERSVRTALDGLVGKGMLALVERGRPRGPRSRRSRSNIYELTVPTLSPAPPSPIPVNGYVGPPAQACGTPRTHRPGAPAQACGTPARLRCPQCGQEHDDQRPYRICLECVAAKRWPTVCAQCGRTLTAKYRTVVCLSHIYAEEKELKQQQASTQKAAAQTDSEVTQSDRAVWRGTTVPTQRRIS
ncbi:hypothetical protein W59_08364 [Rhodococcus opacus RKJ300 = JCM 13270]|uniref:Uncharacterized protein n=1 Tax=Rhodococcus opacus RKJ300 = JCM 13270 TaxID=1165867 RepID=I0WUZ7_RHOOP|nr:hypothetical protein W59_08364 [Rhodococcus opacus RKJ300 = JCM 13270]